MLFAALHESAHGTFETCRRSRKMSVYRARSEVTDAGPNRRDWPTTEVVRGNGLADRNFAAKAKERKSLQSRKVASKRSGL